MPARYDVDAVADVSPPAPESRTSTADRYDVLGYQVRVDAPNPTARQGVRAILHGFAITTTAPAGGVTPYAIVETPAAGWEVRVRHAMVQTLPDLPAALGALEWQIVTAALARCRDRCHLHGAALITPAADGAVLLIGHSGSGKTTLALGLLLRGFAAVSDDVTLIEPATLTPQLVRRAFHLEPATRRLLAARALPPDWELDGPLPGYFLPPRWATQPAPVRSLFFPVFQPGVTASLTPLPIAEAASTLLTQTTTLARQPDVALRTVAQLTARAPCYRLVSGDLDSALDLIARQLALGPHREWGAATA